MFTKILVPLDGSKLSERALPHAVQMARIFHAQLVVLQVLDAGQTSEQKPMIDPVSWKIRKAEAELYLQSIVRNLHAKELEAEYRIMEGKSPETIVTFAHNENIDLLVISSHGQSGLSWWNISSVIQKVIHRVYLPVLIVRAYRPFVEGDESFVYHRILQPLDSSKRAECSLPAAIAMAEACQSKLYLATVLRRPDVPFSGSDTVELSQLADRYMELSRRAIAPYLDDLKNRIPVQTDIRVIESDSITRSLHDIVDQEAIDLVVLCAHGQTGQIEWPYGSVVSNFIEYGSQSVLVIQDIPPERAKPTHAEIASAKYGGR